MDVTLPNGQVIQGIPEGTTKDVIMQKAIESGLASIDDFPQPEQAPQEEPSFMDSIIGGAESAASIISGAVAEPIAGIVGLADAANPFAPEGAGGERVRQVREALTYQPRTEEGIAEQQAVGEALAPVGEAIAGLEESVGEGALSLTGSPTIAAAAQALPAATAEVLTLGALTPATTTAKQLTRQGRQLAKQSATKQKIAKLISEGSTDKNVAKFKLQESMRTGKVKAVKDKVAIESMKQGFDEGVIAAVKGSSKADKAKMLEMTNIMETGKRNSKYAATNRPSDVAGDSLMKRVKAVQDANKAAGKQLDVVAKSLKGQRLDFNPIGQKFVDDLADMGVSVTDDLKLNFKGSDIEGLKGPENAINQIFNRMKSSSANNAFSAHKLKRFIDEQVTYGKNAEGLAGNAERILKSLRKDIDTRLDSKFPEYDRVNTAYAETIGALDAFQDAAGKKMNLTGKNADKATGTLLRRLMGNATSRVNLMDSVDLVEQTANKYKNFKGVDKSGRFLEGAKKISFDDDLLSQILFVDELDNVFGPVARTSFQGQIRQAIPVSKPDAAIKAAEAGIKKIKGVSQEGAFKAIKKLLKE